MTQDKQRTVILIAICFIAVIGLLIFHNLTYRIPPAPTITIRSHTPTYAESKKPQSARPLIAKGIENDLLRAGFDVQVTFIQEDDSRMIIYGKSVNLPFAHNLMASSSFKKVLHDGKFTEVTFMDSLTSPDFSQLFQVR